MIDESIRRQRWNERLVANIELGIGARGIELVAAINFRPKTLGVHEIQALFVRETRVLTFFCKDKQFLGAVGNPAIALVVMTVVTHGQRIFEA